MLPKPPDQRTDGMTTNDTEHAPTGFGARAYDYDRLRPGYPADALSGALSDGPFPATVLDIGCGTGKLATALTSLGLRVTGVEPDPRMAAVAAAKGLDVEVGPFEEWDPAGRRFDVVACGQAWHWLRPGDRTEKAIRCLRPAGRILLAWNFASLPPQTAAGLSNVYASILPDGLPTGQGGRADLTEADVDGYVEELRHHGFQQVTRTSVPWHERFTSQEWCELLGTESRHLALPAATRQLLLRDVAAHLDTEGGRIGVDYSCVLVTASAAG